MLTTRTGGSPGPPPGSPPPGGSAARRKPRRSPSWPEAAGGRADLLAKCSGLALGYGEWQPEAAHYRRMAELCIAAGADQALIGRWIKAGQQRAATGMATPYTALPPGG